MKVSKSIGLDRSLSNDVHIKHPLPCSWDVFVLLNQLSHKSTPFKAWQPLIIPTSTGELWGWIYSECVTLSTFIMCSLAMGKLLIGFPETCKHQLKYTASKHQRRGNQGRGRGGMKKGEAARALRRAIPKCVISCRSAARASLFPRRESHWGGNWSDGEWRPEGCSSSNDETAKCSRRLLPTESVNGARTHWKLFTGTSKGSE